MVHTSHPWSWEGSKNPSESNSTNFSCTMHSIISHLNVHMKILLLQVIEKLLVSCHVEWCTLVEIPHTTHHCAFHACNAGKIKFKLWSQGFTHFSSYSLLACLLVWTFHALVSQFMQWKHLILDMSFFVPPWPNSSLDWDFFPFHFFPFWPRHNSPHHHPWMRFCLCPFTLSPLVQNKTKGVLNFVASPSHLLNLGSCAISWEGLEVLGLPDHPML